jgi:hypothetical protein
LSGCLVLVSRDKDQRNMQKKKKMYASMKKSKVVGMNDESCDSA